MKSDKMEGFYPFPFDIQSKKNEHEYQSPIREPADVDLLHADVVQLISRFFNGQNRRRTFPLSVP